MKSHERRKDAPPVGAWTGHVLAALHPKRSGAVRWILVLLLIAGGYQYYRWSAPYRLTLKFVNAVERRDVATIMALADPDESGKAGLTPEGVAFALDQILPGPVVRDDVQPDLGTRQAWEEGADGKKWCLLVVFWRDAGTGQRLLGKWGMGRPQLRSSVQMRPTARGWKVLVSNFLQSTARSRWGPEQGTLAFAQIAQQTGIRGYGPSEEWVDVAELAQLMRNPGRRNE